MISTHRLGGRIVYFTVPPTAAAVLEWTLQIQCMDSGVAEDEDGSIIVLDENQAQTLAALRWAAQWVELDPAGPGQRPEDVLSVMVAASIPEPLVFIAVVELCNAICAAAGLADSVIDGIVELYDSRNEVPRGYVPRKGMCGCFRCRMARKGREAENPRGEVCVFDGVDKRSVLAAARATEVENTLEPYFVGQVRAAISRAADRKAAYEEELREDKDESARLLGEAGFGGRRG
jgi:hypothetical protein